MGLTREQIAARAALELQDGDHINLGIGIPTLVGNYTQVGVLLGEVWPGLPPQLEVAVRHAFLDPSLDDETDLVQELSLTTNWFLNRHLNKLSAELLWLTEDTSTGDEDSLNFRLQWDISM